MLKRNLSQIYVDEDWVVARYMSQEKSKEWDQKETKEDELVVTLEQELYDEEMGLGYHSASENIQIAETTEEEPRVAAAKEAIPVEDSDTDSDSSDSGATDSSTST